MTTLDDLKEKSTMPAMSVGMDVVSEFFESNKGIMADVLPAHISPEKMLRLAYSAMRTTPKLMECTTRSLMGAVMQCAQLGLEPNTALGHAYLVPFYNKKRKQTDVQVIMGYRGMIALAYNSGRIISISAHEVRQNDEFEFSYGTEDYISHKPALTDRGAIIAFYAVAKMKGGGHAFEVMSKDAVDSIMLLSQSKGKYGPWKDNYEEMGRKTPVRKLFKYLPMSTDMATAAAMDELADRGLSQHLEDALAGEYAVVADDYKEPKEDGATNNQQEAGPEGPPEEGWTFEEMKSALRSAKTAIEIDEIMDLARGLPEKQHDEINQICQEMMGGEK